jgi:hypothetical protein
MANVKMFAPAGAGGSIVTQYSGVVFVAADGTVTVNAADAPQLIAAGYQFAISAHGYALITNPQALNTISIVASVALTAGLTTLSTAHQPDVPRQIIGVLLNSTMSLAAAAQVQYNYIANDGTSQTDTFNMQSGANNQSTYFSSKAVEYLTSVITSGINANTAAAGFLVGTNAFLGVPVPQRFVDFTVVSSKQTNGATATNVWTDNSTTATSTIGAMIAGGAGAISQANTLVMGFGYNYTYPG